jgi:tetratricopeptide (TPR) repeat protein
LPPDKNTILESAQLYTSRGQYDRAIAEWKRLAALAPGDGTVHNTIGDLHLKRDAPGEAVEAYLEAAAAFRAAGAPLKAIAVYKKILKVAPARYAIYKELGDLNAERGLVSDAVSDYLILAKGYLKDGRPADAIVVYETILRLDAAQSEVRRRLADLYLQENRAERALEAYVALGRERLAQGQTQEARAAGEAALKIEPGNPSALALLGAASGEPATAPPPAPERQEQGLAPRSVEPAGGGRRAGLNRALALMEERRFEAAEELLAELLSAEPGDPEICRLLASLHLRTGRLAVAQSEFKFLAESALRALDHRLAESMIREYLAADPDCIALLELLGQLLEQTGDRTGAAAQYGRAFELLLAHPDPEYPTLPVELYGKVLALAPASPLVARYAERFARPPSAEEPAAPAEEPAPPTGPASAASSAFSFKPAGAHAHAGEPGEAVPEPAPTSPGLRLLAGDDPTVPADEDAPAPAAAFAGPAAGAESVRAPEPAEACEEHLELGLAFRYLGLSAEARDQLRIARAGQDTFVAATVELARCLNDEGDQAAALALIEGALADPRSAGTAGEALRYALAELAEAQGDLDRAARLYREMPAFRDSAARLERIEQGGGLPRPAEGALVEPAAALGRKKRRISYL